MSSRRANAGRVVGRVVRIADQVRENGSEGDRADGASEAKVGEAPRQTILSPEGFREPFNFDEVPWRKVSAASTAFKRLGR